MKKILATVFLLLSANLTLATTLICQSKSNADIFWRVDFNNVGATIDAPKGVRSLNWTKVTENVLSSEVNDENIRTIHVLNRVTGDLTVTMLCLANCYVSQPISVVFECKKSEKIEKKF